MDLNINVYKNKTFDSRQQIIDKVKRCLTLGLRTIALTVDIDANDIKQIPNPVVIKVEDLGLKSSAIAIKSRLNVKVDDHMQTHRLNQSENAKKFDILSIEPKTDKILSHLNNGNFECDIISIDFSSNMCPNIRRANFSIPISKGIGLEITYAGILSDATTRRSILSSGQLLIEKTKSRNIILSSGALTHFDLRAPKDVTYLGLLFHLNEDQSKASVFRNGIKVLKHSDIRKNVNMSTICFDTNISQTDHKWLNKEFSQNKRTVCEEKDSNKKVKSN